MWIHLPFLVVKDRKEKALFWTFIDILNLAVCHAIISLAPKKIYFFFFKSFYPSEFYALNLWF